MPEGTPKNLQITRRPSRLMVSLTFEIAKQPLPTSESSVGIDMGVVKRLTLSDGETVQRRVVDRTREKRLRRAVCRSSAIMST